MSAVTIGANTYFNGTAGSGTTTLRIDSGYTADNIFRVGNHSIEVVITNLNGTYANGIRVAFDDSTAIAAGQYITVPGLGSPVVMHPNVKHAIYITRELADAAYSIMVVRKNSTNSF